MLQLGGEGEGVRGRVLAGDAVSGDQMTALQREIQEQETLIAGYQQV